MKDVFATRARKDYKEAMEVVLEELAKHGTVSAETRAALLDDGGVQLWVDEMCRVLNKIKYGKAVQSITGSNPTVFHAIKYRDAAAAEVSQILKSVEFVKCTEAQEDVGLWWETVIEAATSAFRALKKTPPTVPSKEEIAADIQARKNGKAGKPAMLLQGTEEIVRQIYVRHGSTAPADAVVRFKKLVVDDGWSASKTPASEKALLAALSELDGCVLSDDDWILLQQATTFISIEAHVPKGMMAGIESVAQEMANEGSVHNLASAAMNPEFMTKIGEKVLGGVSQHDVSSFANNIDKLLPIITNAAKPP